MTESVLERFFPGHRPGSFLTGHWPGQPLVVHGEAARFSTLDPDGFLASSQRLLALLAKRGVPVSAMRAETRDDWNAENVPAAQGLSQLAAGRTLFVPRIEAHFPELAGWLEQLRDELGLPPFLLARVFAYLAWREGTGAHFDTNANFVVQLTGRKRWSIARNAEAAVPTERYAISMPRPPQALLEYAPGLLRRGPSEWTEIELSPGSAMFLPRGFWHKTEVESESISLHFVLPQPTWLDVLTAALDRSLRKDERWRALADGLFAADPGRRAAGQARLESLVAELAARLPDVRAETMAELCAPRVRRFSCRPGASVVLDGDAIVACGPAGTQVRLDLPAQAGAPLRTLALWAAGRGGGFSDHEAHSRGPAAASDVDELLRFLTDAEVIVEDEAALKAR